MRRRPSARLATEFGPGGGDLLGDGAPLPALAVEQSAELCLLGRQRVEFLLDRDFFEPAQGAQPQIEDRLGLDLAQFPAPHHLGLRVVILADDSDHLVEVEIDDDLPLEDLDAAGNGGEAMPAAAQQYLAAMVEKGLQRLLQAHHPRHAGGIEHIQVERHADFELGQPKQLLHQHIGIDIAALGLDHEPYILGRFVADVGDQRQFLVFEQSGDFFDEAPFRHAIRDLGYDDLVGAVT